MARFAERSEASRTAMHKVYVLKSEIVRKSYVGVTNNLKRRLEEHNSGKHFYTKKYMPWKAIYTEDFDNFKEARKREIFF